MLQLMVRRRGPGFPEWNAARQLFHVPCNCEFPDEHPVTSVFARCRHCHGYSIRCEAPAQAPCKACGRSSDTVCAACHNGFHNMAQCGLRSGVNKEYFLESTELFPVCPDCLWQWAQFLNTSATQTSPLHQGEALSIMHANGCLSCRLQSATNSFLKHFIRSNLASRSSLIAALQAQRGLRYCSEASAADKIDALTTSGHIEIKNGMCYWNHNPTLSTLPEGST